MDENIQNTVNQHYETLIKKGYNVVGVFLYGSQNYGLDNQFSDVDTKAIVLPTISDIIFGTKPCSKTMDMGNGNLCDVKDIRIMFDNYKKQNINYIETLFTNYKIINHSYADYIQPLLDNRNAIATYNNYALLNCISDMIKNKAKNLYVDRPSSKYDIRNYGYSLKDLHHMFRLQEFLLRYLTGETYDACLQSEHIEFLMSIKDKQKPFFCLEDAKTKAQSIVDNVSDIVIHYMQNNKHTVNHEIQQLFDDIIFDISMINIKREVEKYEYS